MNRSAAGGTGRHVRAGLALLALLATTTLGSTAQAARFALLVGNNQGQGRDVPLHFAESDTVRLASQLEHLGGVGSGGAVILLGRTSDELQRALTELATRLRTTPGEHLVVVYYSGHADAQSLHLGASTFPLIALREAVNALPAATRVLILDACQSGVLTRAKGGRAGLGFDVEFGTRDMTKGLAILAASADSELAQESDQLGASVFTHYLGAGLSGLADRNHDGNVSLTEAFDYTADRTLAATLGTTTGPQHPTFRLDLAGRDDLILTRPALARAGYGHVHLDVPGWYFIRRSDGTMAAELMSHGDEALALEPGRYEVSRRERRTLDVTEVDLGDGGAITISQAASRAVPFGKMVRKGDDPGIAYVASVATATRSAVEDLGMSAGLRGAIRADFSALSVELRLGLGRAHQESLHLASTTWESSAAAAVLRINDVAALARSFNLSWGFGFEAGASYLKEALDDGTRRASWGPFAGPVLLAELNLGRRFLLRADLGLPIYALRVQNADASVSTSWRPAVAADLGAGVSF